MTNADGSGSVPPPEPWRGAEHPAPEPPAAQPPVTPDPVAPGYPQPPGPVPYPQPGYPAHPYGVPPGVAPPDNYLVWAILSTVLCCMPLGVVSIVYAAQVNDKWAMGDIPGAVESSRRAKQFAIWSAAVTGVFLGLFALLYIGIFVVAMGASVSGAVTGS